MGIKKHKLEGIDIFYGVLSLCAPFILWFILDKSPYTIANKVNVSDLFAGCFTFSSALLLWITLSKQRISSEKQSIENHFYKMLEITRENSNNIVSKGRKGRDVFANINKEFNNIHEIINDIDGISTFQKIQISWLILFYGLDIIIRPALYQEIRKIFLDDENRVREIFLDETKFANDELKNLAIEHLETKSKNQQNRLNGLDDNNEWLKYDGYQSTLAHYYRHIYQIVTYINEQDILNYTEKYGYIKTLRAQFNVFELILLFYNTISPYGRTWEPGLTLSADIASKTVDNYHRSLKTAYDNKVEVIKKDTRIEACFINDLEKAAKKDLDINNQLITKYQFFRNVTMPLLGGKIRISDFYPMINYENAADHTNGTSWAEYNKLIKQYK